MQSDGRWWEGLWWEGFKEKVSFDLSLEWNKVGVMDNDSGDDETDELRQFGWEEWEKEWSGLGWRNEAENQEVHSKGKEMHNEMSGQWFLKRKMTMVERG